MVLGVGVLRDEVPQDHQHAVVRLAQLADLRGAVLVERAHRISGDDQNAAPHRDVQPAAGSARHGRRGREQHRVVPGHEADEQHAAERGQRGLPPAVQIGGSERRQRVEAQDHPLTVDDHVQQQADEEQGQEDPQLLVDLFERAEVCFHCWMGARGARGPSQSRGRTAGTHSDCDNALNVRHLSEARAQPARGPAPPYVPDRHGREQFGRAVAETVVPLSNR
jgi:hypothetical protein